MKQKPSLDELFKEAPRLEANTELWQRIVQQKQEQERKFIPWWQKFSAAAVLFLAFGIFSWNNFHQSSISSIGSNTQIAMPSSHSVSSNTGLNLSDEDAGLLAWYAEIASPSSGTSAEESLEEWFYTTTNNME
jgi:hypothetical protein